jgi:serine/threonine protein kinase
MIKDVIEPFKLSYPPENILFVHSYFNVKGKELNRHIKGKNIERWHKNENADLIVFESFETDLEEQIQKRSEAGKEYSENELWEIADSVISGLAKMYCSKLVHGSISAENILIKKKRDEDEYVYKLSYI